jgi:hypothetical protein
MKRKYTTLSVFDGNPLVVFCVFFTISILISLVINTILGGTVHFTAIGLINLAVLCATPIVTWTMFDYVPILKHLNDDTCSPWISIPVHFIFSSSVLMLFVFVRGLFLPWPPNAYWDMFFSYMNGYVVIVSGAIVIDLYKTATANKNLKKIQASLGNFYEN